jgi:hypothetical protein
VGDGLWMEDAVGRVVMLIIIDFDIPPPARLPLSIRSPPLLKLSNNIKVAPYPLFAILPHATK